MRFIQGRPPRGKLCFADTMSLTDIQQELERLSSPQIAAHLQRFFKTGAGEYGAGDIFRGIRVPLLRKLSVQYQNISLPEVKILLGSSFHEDRLLALLLLIRLYAKDAAVAKGEIYQLYLSNTRLINNWDLVDSSAEHIVVAYLQDKNRRPLVELAKSSNLWERRIAIMATFHFIKRRDFAETLRVARMLLSDREDLIHKAVGWMLREVGKRDVSLEKTFLQAHYRQMPRVMLRYAIEKFPDSERQQYLRGAI